MFVIKKSVTINAPVKKVFEFMDDPTHLPEIWPSMIEVKNVHQNSKGLLAYDWVYKMAGMKIQGEQDTIERIQDKHVTTKATKGIDSHFVWDYKELEGKTIVDVKIEYSIPIPLVKRIAEQIVGKLNEHEAEITLSNLKIRMEG